jgi:myo-inositol 2-dehydrogenase/D-chiro-inositol 1-dehydrogenase/scyllo-inositol 2-dehydrogenase (NAD+)
MDRVRFCLVGAGRAGMVDARNFEFNVNRSEVVAVVDPAIENARKSAEELGAHYYGDFDEALQNEEFEAVCIGAPTFVHAEAIIRAARAGKHIFTEKPLSITVEEAELIKTVLKENKVKLQIGFMRRFDKNFLRAKELLEAGAIGRPILIKSVGRGPGLPPEWYADLAKSNGLLAEVNSHDFDSLRWLINSEFSEVYAIADNFKVDEYRDKYPDFYDTVALTLKFENGVLGMVDGCCPATYGYDARVEILGTEGMLQIGSSNENSVLVWNKDRQLVSDGTLSWRTLFKDAYLAEAEHFVDCILNDKEPVVGIEDGKKAVEIVVAANRSIKEKRPIKL